jgi:hypothetical protein
VNRNHRHLLKIILIGILAIMLLSAAMPLPPSYLKAPAAAPSDLVRLTIINKSSGPVYMWLSGPSFYYFVVGSGDQADYTIKRGVYSQSVRACGDYATQTVDLTKQTTMIMPVCGGNANAAALGGALDLSTLIKIVRVTVQNDATSQVLAILTGPATYVFLLDVDEANEYTIAKGDYTVQYWACGKYAVKEWSAYSGSLLKLSCPK